MTHIKEYWMKAVAAGQTELSLAEWEKQQAKHTPGPWHDALDFDPCYRAVNGLGWNGLARVVVATVDDDASGGRTPDPEGEANLRLILKAPEMLAKLKEVVAMLNDDHYYDEINSARGLIREIDPTY